MKLPVLNQGLAEQIQQSEIDYLTSRINSIREREGNPEGVEIVRFGHTTGFYIRTMPWSLFNSVKGISDQDVDKLEEIIRFYTAKDRAFQIDVDPVHCSSKLFKGLADHGLYQSGFHAVLYGLPRQAPSELPSKITIVEIDNVNSFDTYAEIHCLASGMALSDKIHFVNNNIGLLNRPGWKLFAGYWEGLPAGVAAMHINGDIASCTLAATIPEYRNRGIQTALLHKRMHEAHLAGCRLITAQAGFGSTSQNNMERAGFQLAWTRAVWTARL
ncbi:MULTISPECIES: GNAT family N-acetyltransferase [Paenibacillus]|uniref:GNAT family acetyltransferase n=1 Tax=Paenibacillus borealis TaxID=160799 RepID=A0ABX3HR95_PAEBO|nr:GNAT family N-acetyltransferase [Paenibacillus borealis]OMD52521.1 GNAT family acetyltransferase [Paenibacillus borealis]